MANHRQSALLQAFVDDASERSRLAPKAPWRRPGRTARCALVALGVSLAMGGCGGDSSNDQSDDSGDAGSGGLPGTGGMTGSTGGATGGSGGTTGGTGGTTAGAGGATGGSSGVTGGTGGATAGTGGATGGSAGTTGGSGGTTGTTGGVTGGSGGVAGEGGQGGAGLGEFGFDYRLPDSSHPFWCDGGDFPGMEYVWPDRDWLCTFADGAVEGYIYVQSTPTEIDRMCIPLYTTGSAQISIDGQIAPLQDAQYYWGGNHHNDSLTFTYAGRTYEYYHSSFGWGWRACQPMDCVRVSDGLDVDDGCTVERTRPVVCVLIEEDGSHAELVDTFAPCPGDPNY